MSATIEITWNCSGCDAKVGSEPLLAIRRFRSFSGRDYGFGAWSWPTLDLAAAYPADWIQDPHTGADYCPKCAAELLEAVSAHQSEASVYCNKCGYFGPADEVGSHPDCNYLAGLNRRDYDLYATAQRIREERGE